MVELLENSSSMMNLALSIDADAADKSGSGKPAFLDFPEENPSQMKLKEWIESYGADLVSVGFGAVMRNEVPREAAKYIDRPTIPDLVGTAASDAAAVASLAAKNADREHQNAVNKIERDGIINEYKTRLAGKLARSLRPRAQLRLEELLKSCPLLDASGAAIAAPYAGAVVADGAKMWRELTRLVAKQEHANVVKSYRKQVEAIRDKQLSSNCSPQQFANVIVNLNKLNPLLAMPYKGGDYVELVLGIMPESLGTDVRSIELQLEKDGKGADEAEVVERCKALISKTHVPGKAAMVSLTSDQLQGMMANAAAAAVKSHKPPPGKPGGKPPGDKPPGDKPPSDGRPPSKYRLPEGTWCKDGSCQFKHDEAHPGAPCFRNSQKAVALPPQIYDDEKHRARIEADREKDRARRGFATKQPVTRGSALNANLADAQVPSMTRDADGAWAFYDSLSTHVGVVDVSRSLLCDDEEEYDGGYGGSGFEGSGDVLSSPVGRLTPSPLPPVEEEVEVRHAVPSPSATVDTPGSRASLPDTPKRPQSITIGSGIAAPKLDPVVETKASPQVEAAATDRAPDAMLDTLVDPEPVVSPFLLQVGLGAVGAVVVFALLAAICALAGGQPALPMIQTTFALMLTQGSPGIARAFGMSCYVPPAAPFDMRVVVAVAGFLFMAWIIAEASFTVLLSAALTRGCRLSWAFIRNATDLRRIARQGGAVVGVACAAATVAMLVGTCLTTVQAPDVLRLPGVGAAHVTAHATAPVAGRHIRPSEGMLSAISVARRGTTLIPGTVGQRTRRALDTMSLTLVDEVTHPAFISSKQDLEELARIAGMSPTQKGSVKVLDSGAAIDIVTSSASAVPGTIRFNSTTVSTANGFKKPELKCDVITKVGMLDGSVREARRNGALIMPECEHELISVGSWAAQGISTFLDANGGSYLQFADGERAPIFNLGVLVLPEVDDSWNDKASQLRACAASSDLAGWQTSLTAVPVANARPVTRGRRGTKQISERVIHARGNHAPSRVLNNWHRCSDAPHAWRVKDAPCHDCLQANSDAVSSDRQAPPAKTPGEYVSFDVYSIGVKHVHGRQTKVINFHDLCSKFDLVFLLKDESEASIIDAIRKCHAFYRAHGHDIKHLHTDNFKSYVSDATKQVVLQELRAVYTTSPPNTPRSNSTSERQWRDMGNDTRKLLQHAKLPRNYAWYALRQAVLVRNTLPFAKDPDNCSYKLFMGRPPRVTALRVWGCVVYPKLYHLVTKMSNQSVACINLGPAESQPGFMCFDPSTKRIHVSSHCRFVEEACPGVTLHAQGWGEVVPSFADEYDDNAPLADDTVEDDNVDPADTLLNNDDTLLGSSPADDDDDHVPSPQQGGESPHQGGSPQLRQPPPPQPASLQRSRRSSTNPYNRVPTSRVLTTMAAIIASLQPGGEAMGKQILGLGDAARGDYVVYLCSGEAHEQDFDHHIRNMSAAEVYVINVDTERAGHFDDLSTTPVTDRLVKLASSNECRGVLASIPCSPYSAARHTGDSGPGPLFDVDNVDGIKDANGQLPLATLKANTIRANTIKICEATLSNATRPGDVILEHPVGRGKSSQYAIKGRERHSPIWNCTDMAAFAATWHLQPVVFDQCRKGADTSKTTMLMCSKNILPEVQSRLGHLICNHPHGTHAPIINSRDAQGNYKTKSAQQFTGALNESLAECFLRERPRSDGWLASIGSVITSFSNLRIMPFSAALALFAQPTDAPDDPMELLRGIRAMHAEMSDDPLANHVLSEAAHAAAVLCAQKDVEIQHGADAHVKALPAWGTFTQLFKVSKAKQHDSDNPSWKQAMSGPEREFWQSACDTEMHNLTSRNIFVEVPEDSLSTWDAIKRRAAEVIEMTTVLKKKYNEMRELLKHKARFTVRGDMEAAIDKRFNRTPAAVFAPTMRHSSFKCIVAASVCRAASKTNGARHKLRCRTADVEAAFLQGNRTGLDRVRHVRPPMGYRRFDRRGVPIVWRQDGNCYGNCDAPRIWYETLLPVLIDSKHKLQLKQSDADPCVLYKIYHDGSRLTLGLYVDDFVIFDDAGPLADTDLRELASQFKLTINDDPKQSDAAPQACPRPSPWSYVPDICARLPRPRSQVSPLGHCYVHVHARSTVGESNGMVTALQRAHLCCHLRPSYQVYALADLWHRWRVATHSLWLRAER